MNYPNIYELKDMLNMTDDEIEFDRQLAIHLSAAKNTVIAFVNRPLFESFSDPIPENAMLVDESIRSAILHLAAYNFDNRAYLDKEVSNMILDSMVGHKRLNAGIA